MPVSSRDLILERLPAEVFARYEERIRGFEEIAARRSSSSPVAEIYDALQGEPPSQREIDVLRLAAEGMTNKEIAARLALSEETVKSHVCRVRAKLEARNRAHAVALCRLGYVDVSPSRAVAR